MNSDYTDEHRTITDEDLDTLQEYYDELTIWEKIEAHWVKWYKLYIGVGIGIGICATLLVTTGLRGKIPNITNNGQLAISFGNNSPVVQKTVVRGVRPGFYTVIDETGELFNSQRELASALNLSERLVSDIINNKATPIEGKTFSRVAIAK